MSALPLTAKTTTAPKFSAAPGTAFPTKAVTLANTATAARMAALERPNRHLQPALTTPAVPVCVEQHRIDAFVKRFPACGMPSIRSVARDFIAQYLAEHGCLPQGRHLLVTGDRNRGFVGPRVDFTPL